MTAYYEASSRRPWSYSWVGLTGIRCEQYIRQILAVAPERYALRRLDTEKYAASIRKAAVLKGTSALHYFIAQTAAYEILSCLACDLEGLLKREESPSLAAQIKFILDAKYAEKLQIRDLASAFHIHPNHLSRVFRERYGISPKAYLQKLKLEKAARMLSTTDAPVALIAESLGFPDQRAFSKSFKTGKGLSPAAYRKKNLESRRDP